MFTPTSPLKRKSCDYNPIDYRVYAPSVDGKTKNEHLRDLLRLAFEEKNIQAQTILFDSWYAASENLKYIHRLGKFFVTTLKENRLVSLSKEQGYVHLQELTWTAEQLKSGLLVKLKEVPFKVQLFNDSTMTVTEGFEASDGETSLGSGAVARE